MGQHNHIIALRQAGFEVDGGWPRHAAAKLRLVTRLIAEKFALGMETVPGQSALLVRIRPAVRVRPWAPNSIAKSWTAWWFGSCSSSDGFIPKLPYHADLRLRHRSLFDHDSIWAYSGEWELSSSGFSKLIPSSLRPRSFMKFSEPP